jgi:1-deoxy-D-xylulose-5-phosphate synthase
MLLTAIQHNGPVALRYPRGAGFGVTMADSMQALPIGMSETLREGDDTAILAIGATVMPAYQAAEQLAREGIQATVVNARFAKPLDQAMLVRLSRTFDHIFTVEENALIGGFGAAVMEGLERLDIRSVQVHRIGVPDRFIDHATQSEQRHDLRLDAPGIAEQIRSVISTKQTVPAGGA